MKLYDFLRERDTDYDTYDDVFDAVVTVVCPDDDDPGDSYDRFCNKLLSLVSVKKEVSSFEAIVNWSELVGKNMNAFRDFTRDNMNRGASKEDDAFMVMWVNDFHLLLAGYAAESFYDELEQFVSGLTGV